jgi:ribonuclease P protein component
MLGVKGNRNIKCILGTRHRVRTADFAVGCASIDYKNSTDNDKRLHCLIVIGKKILKRANTRNTLRRRIRAILITHSTVFYNKHNTILVQVFNKNLLTMHYSQLEQHLLDKFAQLP